MGAIERRTPSYADRRQFFVDQVKYGVALICAAFYPRPVLVRLSDLKSNEYRDLLGRPPVRARRREPDDRLAGCGPVSGSRGSHRPSTWSATRSDSCASRWDSTTSSSWSPSVGRPKRAKRSWTCWTTGASHTGEACLSSSWSKCRPTWSKPTGSSTTMELAGGSIGSNDLVQTVYAVSRDDLEHYAHPGGRPFSSSPFAHPACRVARFRDKDPRDRNLRAGALGLPRRDPAVPGRLWHHVDLRHSRHAHAGARSRG